MWRTLYSLQNEVNAEAAFDADNDEDLIEVADANATAYMMKYLTYETLLEVKQNDGCPWWSWITNPLGCLADLIYDDVFNLDYYFSLSESQTEALMNAYFAGWHWWLNANDSYKTLIGAREFVSESITSQCECTTTNPDGSTSTYTFDTGGEESCNSFGNTNCVYSEVSTYIGIDYASDGVVLAESAMAFPGADVGQDNEMTGSNHQQMRNDSNLEEELAELFNGDHGPFFTVGKK